MTAAVQTRLPVGFSIADRLAVRAMGRALAPVDDKKLRGCGWPINHDDGPGLILVENGMIRGGQRATCGSLTRCGYCTPYRWSLAEAVGVEHTRRHIAAGGWLGSTTLTIPHVMGDQLADLMAVLYDAWRARWGWRNVIKARKALGVVADCGILHVTLSTVNGFHPHLHVAWFCFGDLDCWECFVEELGAAWRGRILNEMGRRPSLSKAVVGQVIRNPQGFWEYVRPDDGKDPEPDDEPADDVAGTPDEPAGAGPVDGDDWPTRGPGLDEWEVDVVSPSVIPDWRRKMSVEVLSGLGRGAVQGDKRSQAAFAEYLAATRKYSRVASTWRSLNAAYGAVELPARPREAGPFRRTWVHPRLLADLESLRPTLGSNRINDYLDGDPFRAAVEWGTHLGADLSVCVHDEDGAPVIGRPEDLDRHPSVSTR